MAKVTCDFNRPALARRFCVIPASTNRLSTHPLIDIHCRRKGGLPLQASKVFDTMTFESNIRECAKDVKMDIPTWR